MQRLSQHSSLQKQGICTPPYEWRCGPQNKTRTKAGGKAEERRRREGRLVGRISDPKRWFEQASQVAVDNIITTLVLAPRGKWREGPFDDTLYRCNSKKCIQLCSLPQGMIDASNPFCCLSMLSSETRACSERIPDTEGVFGGGGRLGERSLGQGMSFIQRDGLGARYTMRSGRCSLGGRASSIALFWESLPKPDYIGI